ncbi:MAG TPA: UDP-N-acetylmuramate dehydrogenase [Prevotellaceae bacterium]|nr:UDP-N-acetylmuramate dehydrogenase [Prevotellaceae bacterium]HBE54566.1 UDP-N-acetylmuramate dehydrogenase [Prevotellaceae bacterium]
MEIHDHCSLLPYNTFGIQAKARVLVSYDSVRELCQALDLHRTAYAGLPLLHIGAGSNLLFLTDYPGMILHSRIGGVTLLDCQGDDVLVRVGAGVVHDTWVARAVASGWHGLENLSLIPGQVGASAVQNIGAYGVEAQSVIERVDGVSLGTGEPRTWTCAQCGYGYRSSVFKGALRGQYAITHVTYRLHRTFVPHLDYGALRSTLQARGISAGQVTAAQLRQAIIAVRQSKLPDPCVQGNAGSFFMNPVVSRAQWDRLRAEYPGAPHYDVDDSHVKVPAGWLIEQAGWKGRALGRAAVHDRQALVLVNRGGATGADILALCDAVRDAVRSRFGIDLRPEVNIIRG